LTPQPTRLSQAKRQIQHIILVIVGLVHLVVECVIFNNDVTGRAGTGATAGSFHLNIVVQGDIEQVVAGFDVKGLAVAFLGYKGDLESGSLLVYCHYEARKIPTLRPVSEVPDVRGTRWGSL
jgi:hypothetical protein